MATRCLSRRQAVAALAAAATGFVGEFGSPSRPPCSSRAAEPAPRSQKRSRARIAITLDLEMSRNFPTWDAVEWDFEKGNLNEATKAYAVEAAARVKRRGGRIHFFVVGRTLEQENVEWLAELARAGHPLGNHTYDHVDVRAQKLEEVQHRFRRAPWLVAGQQPHDVVRENVRLATVAMKERLGVAPSGFRTPGGFARGLADHEPVQRMLLAQNFTWVSSKYPEHPIGSEGTEPSDETLAGIVRAQAAAQPFIYPSGLIEIPMSPISDISAFRNGRWQLPWFLRAVRAAVEWAIEHRAVFDFLAHPSCLYATDPKFQAIDLICDLATNAGDRAELATLDSVAQQVKR